MEDELRNILKIKGPEHDFGIRWVLMILYASIITGTFDGLLKVITNFAAGETTARLEDMVRRE